MKNNEQNDFVHFYQMIDDSSWMIFSSLQAKKNIQDVFFHVFNHLHQTSKQLILTSDKAPLDLQGMEQRLLSPFGDWLGSSMPDLETRIPSSIKDVSGWNRASERYC